MRTTFLLIFETKGDPGPSLRARPCWKIFRFVLENFDFITLIYFEFGQHVMFTICISFIYLND